MTENAAAADRPAGLLKKQPVRVLLVGGHGIVRSGLAALLGRQENISVVGESADVSSALEMAGRLRPDAVVVSVSACGGDGVEAARRIRTMHPSIRVIGLSIDRDEDAGGAGKMLEAGAEACLGRTGTPDCLLAALQGGPEGRGSRSKEGGALESGDAARKL